MLKPMLVVACYDGKVATEWMQSALTTQELLSHIGMRLTVQNLDRVCHVDDAYNMLLKFFLDSDCTHVVTTGSDQGWRPEDFAKLLKHGAKYPVVAGVVPKKDDGETWAVSYSSEELWSNSDGLIEAYTVGTGFMCLSREAVETLARDAERYNLPEMSDIPLIIERRVIGKARWGGDNVLCIKWRELGGKVYVDPDMTFTHTGLKRWGGNAADWYRKRMAA